MSAAQPADRPAFAIDTRQLDGGTCVLAVAGELDLSTAPRLKWALAEALGAHRGLVAIDLTGVTFIDSTALGVLVGAQMGLDDRARLALMGARPEVLKVFELTGMDSTLNMFTTLDEALALSRQGAAAG